jgi:acid phosphatase type 7
MRRRLRLLLLSSTVTILVASVALVAPGAGAAEHDPVIVATGDLACQTLTQGKGTATCQSGAVADLIREIDPDGFLALGDLQYNNGKLKEFLRVWDVQFGDLFDITYPTPGNHEYDTSGATGYFEYFGARAHPETDGYYSFDLGEWHIIAVNSPICYGDDGCAPGSPQHEWLATDLANSDASCTLAFMHNPRYDWRPWQKWIVDDGRTLYGGSETEPLVPVWELLYEAGADVVLVGDNHLYQRWAPQDAHGNAVDDGIVQFTAGTGGRMLYTFGRPPRPEHLEVTMNEAFGVVKLTLHDDSYTHEWVSAPGQPDFEDSGTVDCT